MNVSVPFLWILKLKNITGVWVCDLLFDCFWCCLNCSFHNWAQNDPQTPDMDWEIWSMKGITENIQSASEYVTFALSSTLSVWKQESLLLIRRCCPLNVGWSWRGITRKGKYSRRQAIYSKALEANLCLLPASVYALHQSVIMSHQL